MAIEHLLQLFETDLEILSKLNRLSINKIHNQRVWSNSLYRQLSNDNLENK